MADQSFPQIPSTVWWGMRQLLQRTPKAKYDEAMISASLGVQGAAGRQYLAEMKRAGILDDEGRATPLANRWRMDDTYQDAVDELISACYPEPLTTIAPPGAADRQTVVNWFMSQGLGEGSAKNKAATYLLLSSSDPGVTPVSGGRGEGGRVNGDAKKPKATARKNTPERSDAVAVDKDSAADRHIMPLNVNVQIHISADAGNDQINAIFMAMRKYLRND